MTETHNKPLAAQGLKSYRYKGRFGFIMIGAKDKADALKEAARSISDKIIESNLEFFNNKTNQYEKFFN